MGLMDTSNFQWKGTPKQLEMLAFIRKQGTGILVVSHGRKDLSKPLTIKTGDNYGLRFDNINEAYEYFKSKK